MAEALYGRSGFYRRGESSARHFRTSLHVSPAFTDALGILIDQLDAALGRPDPLDIVDMGAGGGELLTQLIRQAPAKLARRVRACGVELCPRPARLPYEIVWTEKPPNEITGLITANEWLDNVPIDVVEHTEAGPRLVLVQPETGTERLGAAPDAEDLGWLDRWWPLTRVGHRAEIGRPRCVAWAALIQRLTAGLAIAVDYAHERGGRPEYGTLTGYRAGRQVRPVPDGSCDITAHVALDACASAGEAAGAAHTVLTTQRAALRALGLSGKRPSVEAARPDPRGYLTALTRASEEAELIDPEGLGGFGWLIQAVGIKNPAMTAWRT